MMRKPLSVPPAPIGALVAAIETARGVTLAPMKDKRHANP